MENSSSVSFEPRNKFDTIQLFRFIAALTVIIFHSCEYTRERLSPGFTDYRQGGSYGVSLFFVISGFVMILSSESLINKQNGWKIFSVKRLIRIVPIYWILTTYKVLTLIFAASLITHPGKMDIWFILKSYFFIPALNAQNSFFPTYNVGWTLNFEMFFYLLFAIALFVKIRPIILLGGVFVIFAFLSIYQTDNWSDFRFYFNPIVLFFLYGMIIGKLILRKWKLPEKVAVPVIIIGLLYLFLPKIGVVQIFFDNNVIFLNLAAFFVVYAGASIENKSSFKIPSWMVFMGGASYSLYLIHPSVAPLAPMFLKILNINMPWLSLILAVIISLVCGSLFYVWCEIPITNYINKKAQQYKLLK